MNHSIAHALGVIYDTHHGLANAAILTKVMHFNMSDNGVKKKLASLGPLLKTKSDAETVLKSIEEWLISLGLPTNLKKMGIERNQIQDIEAYALEDPCCPLNPKRVERGDVVKIIKSLL